ncbi:hypothetical protein NWF32_05475 [Pseudomonas qingdaonensis]|nr:hypothetical protein [Pseudomonas qingdaonensis]
MDVVGDDREYEWSLDGQRWLQDAHGRFSLTHVAGKALEDAQPDLDFLVGAQQAPGAQGWLPASFRHCPQTGTALTPVRFDRQQRWLPPYGNGSGRRVVEGSCRLDGAEHTLAALYRKLDGATPRSLNTAHKYDQLPRKNGLNFRRQPGRSSRGAVCAGPRRQPVPLAAPGPGVGGAVAAQHPDRPLQPAQLGVGREPARGGRTATPAAGL